MRAFASLVIIFISLQCQAQFNNNFWCFGDSIGIDWTNAQNPSMFKSSLKWRGGSATIGNSSGLLLYESRFDNTLPSNNIVWNKYHSAVANGKFIYGGGWYHDQMFLPDPFNDSIIHLFSTNVTSSGPYGLYHTIINYKLNNDSGLVIQKNLQILSYPAFDGLTAVKNGNGRDWWIIFQRWYANSQLTNEFFIFLLSPSGISPMMLQTIGSGHTTNAGCMTISTNGEKLIKTSWQGLIEMFDFDRCTGTISNPVLIEPEITPFSPSHCFVSNALSSDDSKLYISNYNSIAGDTSFIYQYDLSAPNIFASKQIIFSYTDPVGVGNLKLAPDNKIYLSCQYECPTVSCQVYPDSVFNQINSNLSVINYPDSLGVACDFQPFSLYLDGGRTYYGMPNIPDYQ